MERRLRTLAPVAPDIRPPPPLAPGEAVAIAARHHRSGSDGSPLAVPPPLLPRSHHWQPGGSSSSTSISSPILSLSSPLSSPARLSKRGGNGGGSARSNTSGHNGNGNGNNNNNTAVACDPCRKRKCKCDGAKPCCGSCGYRGAGGECKYTGEQSGRARAIRLDKRNADLERENDRLRHLYRLLGEMPETEAREVLRRVRAAEDPLAVLNYIRDQKV
ncbi:hypothetical protein MGN70_012053 [Eutypa lata]|nr:hypothetical protein MGN70_012053 [Eutypa lata]